MTRTLTPVETGANFQEIRSYVQTILTVAAPLVQVALPGSEWGVKIANILGVVGKYFQFGDVALSELSDFAKELRAIRDGIQADIDAGKNTVDAEQWQALKLDIDAGAARITSLLEARGIS